MRGFRLRFFASFLHSFSRRVSINFRSVFRSVHPPLLPPILTIRDPSAGLKLDTRSRPRCFTQPTSLIRLQPVLVLTLLTRPHLTLPLSVLRAILNSPHSPFPTYSIPASACTYLTPEIDRERPTNGPDLARGLPTSDLLATYKWAPNEP